MRQFLWHGLWVFFVVVAYLVEKSGARGLFPPRDFLNPKDVIYSAEFVLALIERQDFSGSFGPFVRDASAPVRGYSIGPLRTNCLFLPRLGCPCEAEGYSSSSVGFSAYSTRSPSPFFCLENPRPTTR